MFNLFLDCFRKKYFQFVGRADRREYISFVLFNLLIIMLINIIYFAIGSDWLILLKLSYMLYSFIPSITLKVRRLHDLNLSGWWVAVLILVFILVKSLNEQNIINIICLSFLVATVVYLTCKKGNSTPNKYGEPPEY